MKKSMNNETYIGGAIGTALSAVGTATQTNDILQTISLVITIIGGLITFIIVPLLNWHRKAKEDGKIDKDEINDVIDIVADGSKKLTDEIDNKKEEGKKNG